ncbi:sulfotransferase [uncultured Pseudokineococcus sp.]|uniref:sulfotransferase n=1 Tax=uncultured Pseudokineococcus sp. TaxID=1642928 RepID=UPI00260FDAFB|nr:sulfotransferase [uncultured Pseudokineococcus sp.]
MSGPAPTTPPSAAALPGAPRLAVVTGTGRSGTTLVTEVVARHPATGFVSGVDDKLWRLGSRGRWNSRLYRAGAPRPSSMRALSEATALLERGRMGVRPSEAYALFDRHVMPGFSAPCRDLLAEDLTPHVRRRLVAFVEERRRAQGAEVLLQHLTGWPRTGLLREALPELRTVNVVRDGRAVASSWLQMGWWDGRRGPDRWIYGPLPPELHEAWDRSGRDFAVLAALGWRMLLDAAERARALTPPGQWLDVRYEDLLADPRAVVGEVLHFLGLPWTPAFEAGLQRHRLEGGRREAFRDELTAAQLAAVEQVLAEPLARWGYAVG